MSGLRSKMAATIAGAVLFAVVGGVIAAWSALPRSQGASQGGEAAGAQVLIATNTAASAPAVSATLTATATNLVPTTLATQTATPMLQPTVRPTQPPGGVLDLHGTVLSVNTSASTFSYRLTTGATMTVVTNAQTQFTGSATQLVGLQPEWLAEVKGSYQAGGMFLATLVDSNSNN